MKYYYSLLIALVFTISVNGQKLYIGLGANWFLPIGTQSYATKHLIYIAEIPFINKNYYSYGGFQLSGLYTSPFKSKSELNYQLSIAKISHWEATNAKSIDAQSLGTLAYSINNYCSNASVAFQQKLNKRFSFGAGVGLNISWWNNLSLPIVNVSKQELNIIYGKADATIINPFIPLNVKCHLKNWIIGADYNQQLLRTFGSFSSVKGANYGVVQLNILRKI